MGGTRQAFLTRRRVLRGAGRAGLVAAAAAAETITGPGTAITIARGSAKATATGVRLTRAGMVLATVQEHMPGVFIEAAVPDFDKRSITVHLSKAAAQNTKVAWFVVNQTALPDQPFTRVWRAALRSSCLRR
jgi:hypothetical protein